MKLTLSIVAALAALLYTIIKMVWPTFPLDQATFYTILLWFIVTVLGLAVEPGIRNFFVRRGLEGFRKK